jgi:hypothetical protein
MFCNKNSVVQAIALDSLQRWTLAPSSPLCDGYRPPSTATTVPPYRCYSASGWWVRTLHQGVPQGLPLSRFVCTKVFISWKKIDNRW